MESFGRPTTDELKQICRIFTEEGVMGLDVSGRHHAAN